MRPSTSVTPWVYPRPGSEHAAAVPRRAADPAANAYAGLPGRVYLLHFVRPFSYGGHQAQHYLGWSQDVPRRLREHRQGRGSYVTRVAHRQGVPFILDQTWPGTLDRERELRALGGPRLCRICQAFDPLAARWLP